MNVSYYYFNGEILDETIPIYLASERCTRYGDGVFESLVAFGGRIPLLHEHLQRITIASEAVSISIDLVESNISDVIWELAEQNNCGKDLRIGISVNRAGGGRYIPAEDSANLLITVAAHTSSCYELNIKGNKLGVYKNNYKTYGSISRFKTSSSLLYVLAGIYCRDEGFDDCLILNSGGEVAEALSSNIFLWKGDKLHTPELGSACVSGIMRDKIIEICNSENLELIETSLKVEDVLTSDEVFTTNAVHGIQWIRSLREKTYTNQLATKLLLAINKKWGFT